MPDDVLVEEELEESLQEIGGVSDWADGAVLWSTDWTAETILSQLTRDNLDLDPSFQRRSAWSAKKQSLFIESLILGLPIPQLILAEAQGKKGSFIVIDGKQRLLAIRRFSAKDTSAGFEPLKLTGLNELSRLNNKRYEDLLADPTFSNDLAAFQNSSVRTIVIRNWRDEAYLYEVFLRINTGSVQLSPQELRQALHPGPFSTFVDDASATSEMLKAALNLNAPDFRMRDAEILLRFLAYRNFMDRYQGNLKRFLDDTTKWLNADWATKESELRSQVVEMDAAIEFTRRAFGEAHYLRKWNGSAFEPRKNRAVFDIMLHYFSVPAVRAALTSKSSQIVKRFKALSEDDSAFRASLETTTKSITANQVRFNLWGAEISELSGINLDHMKFPG